MVSVLKELSVLRGKNVLGGSHTRRVKLGLIGDFTNDLYYFIKAIGCFILLVIGTFFGECCLEPKVTCFPSSLSVMKKI